MTKVYVGMSGGVDSSVTAKLLVDQGYEVTGVFMKNWTQDLPGMRCPWAEDLADAKRVAVQLKIPLKVYDFQSEYRSAVVDYMIEEYTNGRTPNPDIMCNQEVKFKLFLDAALSDGADFIATGHYARVHDGRLYKARDDSKDQTYFLYRVTRRALEKTIFPLGELKKTEVRSIATEAGLVTARKKDSQGICFVGSIGIKDFLSEFVDTVPGDVIEKDSSKVVGRHEGAIFYTLGQRHGLQIGGGLPYYVVGKDMASNTVYVSRNINDDSMWRNDITVQSPHWIHSQPASDEVVGARFRHRGAIKDATLNGDVLHVDDPERSVAAGQSVVIYRDEEVLGGAIVTS